MCFIVRGLGIYQLRVSKQSEQDAAVLSLNSAYYISIFTSTKNYGE